MKNINEIKIADLTMIREPVLCNDMRFESGAGFIILAIRKDEKPDKYGCVNSFEVLLKEDIEQENISFECLEDSEVYIGISRYMYMVEEDKII